jgi:threonine/homoserine/homoserine lactone efflux protein
MFGIHDLSLFIASGLLLNLVPGPDSLLIMARSAAQGWRAGSAAALGIGAGTMVHVCAAAIGLSALLATSAAAFTVVKLAGAAYILYVGLHLLLHKKARGQALAAMPPIPPMPPMPPILPIPYRKLFFQGFLTNVLNPKVALFFLAFVPQFISADATNKALAFIVLGCIFNANSMLWCHFLAASSAMASQRLKLNPAVTAWLNRITGGLFIALGIKLALSKQAQ